MIEKRITQQLLEVGELNLTERECGALTLPEHSTSLDLELDGEPFHAQWSGRSRQLTGDVLTERLQDYGQDGGLLRLRLVDKVYRLQLLPPGTPLQVTIAPPTPVVATKTKSAKAKRRATVDRQFHADAEYDWGTGTTKTIGFLSAARELLGEQLKAAGFDPLEIVELRLQGEELATLDDFEELLAVDVANVDKMPHQESVARHALSRLRGRAVLADEVGLGKTIEAGLAVKELTLRGLGKRVLILCPAPLRDQWREEMSTKFDLSFDVAYRGPEVQKQDKLILSLTLGRTKADQLTKTPWDIVIIDEAHRAAGRGAQKTRELITSLTTSCRYAFFLTATPVQNDLLELYRLVELLRPGTFESVNAFKRQFMRSYDPRVPHDPAALRRLISSVMVRTTRAQAGVDRVTRRAVDVPVDLGPRERELYAMCVHLLRDVMRDSGDTMRRRSLALRLTASPFSMGTTAMRMATRHPDPHVREVLNEIGHRAMDIEDSARENKAVEITRKWLKEHGRVLIFTQHTDTVTGLLRRLAREGLTARSFHGSMSAGERAATIAAFRSGESPIMISTDAGAEGQNLQFCNCVLNYDLPWNPMRIEQRIGRVDRLTQPKDEVFIANLYARGTIDESVYKLLAEKLRMFELLFGQVTTILGELDDSKSATFESRVLEALFSDDDKKMQGLLGQLGTELAHAREKASELIAADSGMSSWMAEAFEHRKGLTKAGSTELAPEVSERARMRQRRVQTWVRSVLKALDAQLIHDTGEGTGAFITAQFDEEFEPELGGRTLMHLAFDRLGMEHHPDAELCAVGSPVFDELLGLLRMRGDMHATVPIIPDDIGPSPYPHASTIRLLRRRLVPSGSWSGQATFRATIGESESTEHLITADVNAHQEHRLERRPLNDGESLTPAFETPTKIIKDFERAAFSHLESLRRERSRQVQSDQKAELRRITSGYTAQISEAAGEDKGRLKRALASEERRLSRQPDIRGRAKLLAVTLDEDDWIIEETWAGPNESEGTLTYEWGLAEPTIVESDVSGEPIKVLALCSSTHWVDESETSHCPSCDGELCSACGDNAMFTDCSVCGLAHCGFCRQEHGGLCWRCASPERASDLDNEFLVAWTLNAGNVLRVGSRSAELVSAAGYSNVIVSDSDADDRERARMLAYALHNNLPADCGLSLRDLTQRQDVAESDRVSVHTSETVDIEIAVSEAPGDSSIDPQAVADLPECPDVQVTAERELQLGPLLTKLRSEVPPKLAPTVVLTRRSTFTDLYLSADGLIGEIGVVSDDGSIVNNSTRFEEFSWKETTSDSDLLAEARIDDYRVTLHRRNEAILANVTTASKRDHTDQWAACPSGMSMADQIGCFERLESSGMPGGRIGKLSHEVTRIVAPFPEPSECQLTTRDIRPTAEIVELHSDLDIEPADDASLSALGIESNTSATQGISVLPAVIAEALLERARRSFTTALCNGLSVTETWQGHGTATHTYTIFDGNPLAPKTDDQRIRESDFGVCRDGHFYTARASALCASCETWSCRACDDITHQASIDCPTCSKGVCRRCLSAEHNVPTGQCLSCGDHACTGCGRDPNVVACAMCDRSMCTACRVHDLCTACATLRVADSDTLSDLPDELAVRGASVLIGTDNDATVLLINRGNAHERAVVRNHSVEQWVAYSRSEIDASYRLRLTASRHFQAQVIPTFETLATEEPFGPRILIESERRFHAGWSVPDLDLTGRSAQSHTDPHGDLAVAVSHYFSPAELLPSAEMREAPHLRTAFEKTANPRTHYLNVRWDRVGHDVAVVSDGVGIVSIERSGRHESVSPWIDGRVDRPWVTGAWSPAPAVRAHVSTPTAEAVIVGMASLLALGVRAGEKSDWYVITAYDQAPAATALSRMMGLGDADEVSTYTDPNRVVVSRVTNAVASSMETTPVGVLGASQGRGAGALTIDALRALAPEVNVVVPPLQALPHELRVSLEGRGRLGEPTALAIGAHVVELVTTAGGQEWRFDSRLGPGQTDARRADKVSRNLLDAGVVDREGHFVASCPQCTYCAAHICTMCTDNLVSCDCCGAPICKRCVLSPQNSLWVCPACSSARPPTRAEAREHGRLLFTRGMLIGSDPVHTVVFEQSKSRWTRHADGEQKAIANPSVAKFLDGRLSAGGEG